MARDNFDILFLGIVIGIPLGIGILWGLSTLGIRILPRSSYSNLEEWEFLKDGEGMIQGVRIHRKAQG